MNDETESGVMTIKEVAAYLRVHQTTIYRLIKQRAFPAFKIGSDWRFLKSQVRKWMQDNQMQVSGFSERKDNAK